MQYRKLGTWDPWGLLQQETVVEVDSSGLPSLRTSFEPRSNFAPISGVVVTSYVNCKVRPGNSFLKAWAVPDQELSAIVRLLPQGSFGAEGKNDAMDARDGT